LIYFKKRFKNNNTTHFSTFYQLLKTLPGITNELIETRIQEALVAQAETHRKESADKEQLIIAGFESLIWTKI